MFMNTVVDSAVVVDKHLIKNAIQFDGTTAAMERSIDDLFERRELLEREIQLRGLSLRPKSVYVCRTNITDDGQPDDPAKPFHMRSAPPIRIWRYLVEKKGVSPASIAILPRPKIHRRQQAEGSCSVFDGRRRFRQVPRGRLFAHYFQSVPTRRLGRSRMLPCLYPQIDGIKAPSPAAHWPLFAPARRRAL